MCDAPIEIAGKFCEYFSNIGPKLAEKYLTRMTLTCIHAFYPPKRLLNSLFFDPASSQEIIHICNSLRPGIAAGYDNYYSSCLFFLTCLAYFSCLAYLSCFFYSRFLFCLRCFYHLRCLYYLRCLCYVCTVNTNIS